MSRSRSAVNVETPLNSIVNTTDTLSLNVGEMETVGCDDGKIVGILDGTVVGTFDGNISVSSNQNWSVPSFLHGLTITLKLSSISRHNESIRNTYRLSS